MNYSKRIFLSVFWIVLGIVLAGSSYTGKIDEFWGSMGFALISV